jgi:hypothetical protein
VAEERERAVVLATRSLMDASRLGGLVSTVRSLDDPAARGARLLIVDGGLLASAEGERVSTLGVPWVALVSHADEALRERARALGARRVVARSWLLGASDPAARIARLLTGVDVPDDEEA